MSGGPLPATTSAPEGVVIGIYREMFSDFWTITMPNGHTEELHTDDIRQWFKDRGADMDACDKVLDYVWNFQSCSVRIHHYREPVVNRRAWAAKL